MSAAGVAPSRLVTRRGVTDRGGQFDESAASAHDAFPTGNLHCIFRCGGVDYALPAADVSEIVTPTPVARIPHAPREFRGLANVRGAVYLVLDAAAVLGHSAAHATAHARILLFKPHVAPLCGLWVDDVRDVIALSDAHVLTSPGAVEPTTTERRLAEPLPCARAIARVGDEFAPVIDTGLLLRAACRHDLSAPLPSTSSR